MVDEAHEQGVIEENEAEMIQNIMEFNDTEAKDIMTHRKNVIAFDQEENLQSIVDTMLEEGNSRYPVYKETIDNIVGIIHYKDALKFLTRNSWAKFKPLKDLPGLIREASFIPETRGISDLFGSMQVKKIHMAVVVDEYGQNQCLQSGWLLRYYNVRSCQSPYAAGKISTVGKGRSLCHKQRSGHWKHR